MADITRTSRRSFLTAGGAASLASLAGCTSSLSMGGGSEDSNTVKIGVLASRSGNFSLLSTPKWQAAKLAIDEMNNNGGILGKQIKLIDPDPQSDNQRYKQLTKRLIEKDKVDALWAGYSSATRETIRPTIDRHQQLYFYTTQYEGGVADSTTFCTGATARQQLGMVVPYLIKKYGPKIYTIAADYNFGQLSAEWIKIIAKEHNANVIGEEFIPLSVSKFGSTINKIQKADPDFVMALLVGNNHSAFWQQRKSAGLWVPMGTSTVMAQSYQQKRIAAPALKDVYGGFNYMQEIPTKRNQKFKKKFYDKYPKAPYLNEPAQNEYFTLKMYKKAAEKAGTLDQSKIIDTLEQGMKVSAPEGDVSLQGKVHHMTHNMRVMRCDANNDLHVEEKKKLPEKFLSDTVGVNLRKQSLTKQYVPSDYYNVTKKK